MQGSVLMKIKKSVHPSLMQAQNKSAHVNMSLLPSAPYAGSPWSHREEGGWLVAMTHLSQQAEGVSEAPRWLQHTRILVLGAQS